MKTPENEIQTCLTIDDNSEAFSCVKKVVNKYANDDSVCRPRLVLMVQKGCSSCKKEAALHAADIANGTIIKVSAETPEGQTIMSENGIDMVPAILLLDCHNKSIDPV